MQTEQPPDPAPCDVGLLEGDRWGSILRDVLVNVQFRVRWFMYVRAESCVAGGGMEWHLSFTAAFFKGDLAYPLFAIISGLRRSYESILGGGLDLGKI